MLQKVANANDPRSMRVKHGNRSCSSNSFSSNTTAIKSLSEVKNPSLLISFRFVNRGMESVADICKFRNLTELDLSGNLLRAEVTELIKLPFLKKLLIASNQSQSMWRLPTTLEYLNIAHNQLAVLDSTICSELQTLKVVDISNNDLKSLDGVQHLHRLKRLICRGNKIFDLGPLHDLVMMVEIDLQDNPIESSKQIVHAILNKKEILIFNLRQTPIALKTRNAEELFNHGDPLFSA